MKRLFPIFLTVFFGIASCGGLGLSSSSDDSGSDTDTCDTADSACFQESLRLVGEDGADIDLVDLTGTLPAASDSPDAPSITSVDVGSDSGDMDLGSTSTVQQLWITFSDPLGSRPAFCFQTCPKNVMCVTGGYRCTRSSPDGLTTGTYKTWLGYRAEPADSTTTEELILSVTPIAAPDGADPVEIFEDALAEGQDLDEIDDNSIVIGDPIEIDQTVTAESDGDSDDDSGDSGDDGDTDNSGTSNEGDSCSASSQCTGDCFTTRSCVRGMSCSCAGSSSSGVCYDLSCESLGGTCGDGTHACCVGLSCTNGTCVNSSTDSCY